MRAPSCPSTPSRFCHVLEVAPQARIPRLSGNAVVLDTLLHEPSNTWRGTVPDRGRAWAKFGTRLHLQKHGLTRIGAIPRCLADRIMFRHHAPLCSQETVRGWVAPACACAPNVTWASLASISTTILSQLRQPVIGHVWQGIVYEPTATWIGGQNSPKAHRYRMIPSGTSASRNIQTSS